MTRYKTIELNPRLLTVDLEKQLLPCRFAHAVHHLLEHDFDLSMLDTRYRTDETGASVQTGIPAVSLFDFHCQKIVVPDCYFCGNPVCDSLPPRLNKRRRGSRIHRRSWAGMLGNPHGVLIARHARLRATIHTASGGGEPLATPEVWMSGPIRSPPGATGLDEMESGRKATR